MINIEPSDRDELMKHFVPGQAYISYDRQIEVDKIIATTTRTFITGQTEHGTTQSDLVKII